MIADPNDGIKPNANKMSKECVSAYHSCIVANHELKQLKKKQENLEAKFCI